MIKTLSLGLEIPEPQTAGEHLEEKSLKIYSVVLLFYSHLILVIANDRLQGWMNFWCVLKWLLFNPSSHPGKEEGLTLYGK